MITSLNKVRVNWPDFSELIEQLQFSNVNQWKEGDSAYTMIIELPGVSKENTELKTNDHSLLLEYTKGDGAVKKTILLPKDANISAVSATQQDGLLTITAAKSPEYESRLIKIK